MVGANLRAWSLAVSIGLPLLLAGCDEKKRQVVVEQPIGFSHKKHLDYFTSGDHRREQIAMHMEAIEEPVENAPPRLVKGECLACHDDLVEDAPRCAGCHLLFQDAVLRGRDDVRACVGCHRKAWTGYAATIPSAAVCASCHEEKPRGTSAQEKKLREYLARDEDVPWIQLHRSDPHVHFSHKAHIRYAGLPCTRCHDDVRELDAPVSTIVVFSMEGCIGCHSKNQASVECLACHK